MPKFLEAKLKREYPNDPAAPYKIMNSIGAMKGNRITPKGVAMERKHEADTRVAKPHIDRGHTKVVNPGTHAGKLAHE